MGNARSTKASKTKSTAKAKKSTAKYEGKTRKEAPTSLAEVLSRADEPATEPVPAEIAAKLSEHRVVVSSTDAYFDPRKQWSRLAGSKTGWELATREPITAGLPITRIERLEPEPLARARGALREISPYRPPWQPLVHQPKRALIEKPVRTLRRRNGAKVEPLTVFNHDDREIFLPVGYPWHCIGKLSVTTASGVRWNGTGSLVGKSTVITAEHVVPWGDWGRGATILFQPGYFSPGLRMLLGYGPAIGSWVTEAWGYVNAQKDGRLGIDLATLRLERPMGEWLGNLGAKVYDDDWEDDPRWTLVGYPAVVGVSSTPSGLTSTTIDGEFPTWQSGISVEDDDTDGSGLELETYADATPGNSGGPLFGYWEKGPYAIGVMSSEERASTFSDGINIVAGGNAMLALIHRALSLWG